MRAALQTQKANPDQSVEKADIEFAWCGDMTFVNWFVLLNDVITEDVQLKFDPEQGIVVHTFDQASHIGFVHTVLNPTCFSDYRAEKLPADRENPNGKPFEIVVDLKLFSVILSKLKAQDEVRVTYLHSKAEFYISIRSAATKQLAETETRWRVPIVDKQYDALQSPDVDWDAAVTMRCQELFRTVSDLSGVSDIAVMIIDKDGFEMQNDTVVGGVTRRINEFSKNNTVQLLELKPPAQPDEMHLTLMILMKAKSLCALADMVTVKLHFANDMPALCLEARFNKGKGAITYWQAGRIKENDNF